LRRLLPLRFFSIPEFFFSQSCLLISCRFSFSFSPSVVFSSLSTIRSRLCSLGTPLDSRTEALFEVLLVVFFLFLFFTFSRSTGFNRSAPAFSQMFRRLAPFSPPFCGFFCPFPRGFFAFHFERVSLVVPLSDTSTPVDVPLLDDSQHCFFFTVPCSRSTRPEDDPTIVLTWFRTSTHHFLPPPNALLSSGRLSSPEFGVAG